MAGTPTTSMIGDVSMPRRRGHGRKSLSKSFFAMWPLLNLMLVVLLITRRLDPGRGGGGWPSDTDPGDGLPPCGQELEPVVLEGEDDTTCDADCDPHGRCIQGGCVCDVGWGGALCTEPACSNDCNGHGTCQEGECICRREWAGVDCMVDVAELQVGRMVTRLGAPFSKVENKALEAGKFEDDVELAIHTKSYKKYQKVLCRTKACVTTWITQLAQLMPFLPRDDYRPQFKTCAVVSSAKQLVYGRNASHAPTGTRGQMGQGHKKKHKVQRKWARKDSMGAQIDRHTMVLRLDNAPTEGFEQWVGSRTTHRLITQEYARLVLNMLGTEVVINQTKSVVTASTWGVEKVTYMLAVPGQESTHQLRAPEHNGYGPFTEVFPGNRRLLISPIFMRRALEAHEKVRDSVRAMGLGCFKSAPRLPMLLLAVLWSLQLCGHVDLYGASVGGVPDFDAARDKIKRDKKYRVRYREAGGGVGGECCYHQQEAGYVAEAPLCDELSRRHALRLLLETGRLRVYE